MKFHKPHCASLQNVMPNAWTTETYLTIMPTKRQIFLNNFLRLYGVDNIDWLNADTNKVFGTAIYNDQDRQDFCWHMTEEKVPSNDLIELIQVIKKNAFNKSDKIIVSPDKLFEKIGWTDRTKFDKTFYELFDVEVKMLDDGEETDSYFMHK